MVKLFNFSVFQLKNRHNLLFTFIDTIIVTSTLTVPPQNERFTVNSNNINVVRLSLIFKKVPFCWYELLVWLIELNKIDSSLAFSSRRDISSLSEAALPSALTLASVASEEAVVAETVDVSAMLSSVCFSFT